MALESQGVRIYRANTTAVVSTGATITVTPSSILNNNEACDFSTFSTDMWISFTNDTSLYPMRSTGSTAFDIFGLISSNATGTTNQTVYGYPMTLIGEITDFTGPGGAAAVIDVTNLNSTSKEKLVGLRDEGQVSMTLNFNATDSGQKFMQADRTGRTRSQYAIQLTDLATSATGFPSYCVFSGYCLNFSISGAVDDKITCNCVIEVDGPVRWSTKSQP